MCTHPVIAPIVERSMAPAHRISEIILAEAGYYINPTVILLILKCHWPELAKAAHEIHGDQQQ
jgi:hypothetical protein